MTPPPNRPALRGALVLLALGAASLWAADEPPPPAADPAIIQVGGLGWWKSRELRQTLALLQPEDEPLVHLDTAFLEDAVVLLQSSLERDGFLRSGGTLRLRRGGADLGEFPWTPGDVPALPRDMIADRAAFRLEPGVRYTFDELAFTGLTALDDATARAYFIEEGFLLGGGGARRFTPGILRTGAANLNEQLVRMGFADATVEVVGEERDDATGRVNVAITVEQGPRHHVGTIALPADLPSKLAEEITALAAAAADSVYSPVWQQDFAQSVRAQFYAHGYAAAEVRLLPTTRHAMERGDVQRDFQLEAQSGPLVRVGAVKFVGDERTAESVLRRATTLRTGDVLDRRRIEEDRLQLGALGAFASVRVEVEESASHSGGGGAAAPADQSWDVTYRLRPGRRLEASLLAGYGSYEQLRGGVELLHTNLLGRAHRGRAQVVYSQRSAYGDYLYTVPQIFGTRTDATARVFGLLREEVSFDREEYGINLGLRRHIRALGADASVRYVHEFVGTEATGVATSEPIPPDQFVGAVTFDLTRDRLDNPITPRRGQFAALTFETASQALGGEVNYQRLDLRLAWHRQVGREKFVHVGLRHGLVWAFSDSSAAEIPLAKRFLPGGESTMRGYREGRASPRDAEGAYIGAVTSTIVNLEFEQGIARGWSGVVFIDAGLTAADLNDYPGDETRVSVGLGLRFNTVIGPARLEYGYNVVRESGDGRGALHFALGFPF